jgi:hypothetical protein
MVSLLQYAKQKKADYLAGLLSAEGLIRAVKAKAEDTSKGVNIVVNGTRTFVKLSVEFDGEFITKKNICSNSRDVSGPTAGLYPWLEGGADIVEKKPGSDAYQIQRDFREAFERVFL